MASTLPIREVTQRAGLASSTLRYYERCGLIEPEGRDTAGRRYRPEVLTRLRIIGYFQQAGYTLAEIGELLAQGSGWRDSARDKREELEDRIRTLRQAQQLLDAALACGCDDVEGCAAHREQIDLGTGRDTGSA